LRADGRIDALSTRAPRVELNSKRRTRRKNGNSRQNRPKDPKGRYLAAFTLVGWHAKANLIHKPHKPGGSLSLSEPLSSRPAFSQELL